MNQNEQDERLAAENKLIDNLFKKWGYADIAKREVVKEYHSIKSAELVKEIEELNKLLENDTRVNLIAKALVVSEKSQLKLKQENAKLTKELNEARDKADKLADDMEIVIGRLNDRATHYIATEALSNYRNQTK